MASSISLLVPENSVSHSASSSIQDNVLSHVIAQLFHWGIQIIGANRSFYRPAPASAHFLMAAPFEYKVKEASRCAQHFQTVLESSLANGFVIVTRQVGQSENDGVVFRRQSLIANVDQHLHQLLDLSRLNTLLETLQILAQQIFRFAVVGAMIRHAKNGKAARLLQRRNLIDKTASVVLHLIRSRLGSLISRRKQMVVD